MVRTTLQFARHAACLILFLGLASASLADEFRPAVLEVVEGEKFKILKSLESEYESQVWTEANYNWILAAYTLLVALALLMLLLFLRKYREEVYQNNTKITFIFFNIILMVVLTTLVANYDSSYIYIVPLCILPLV